MSDAQARQNLASLNDQISHWQEQVTAKATERTFWESKRDAAVAAGTDPAPQSILDCITEATVEHARLTEGLKGLTRQRDALQQAMTDSGIPATAPAAGA